MLLSPPKTSKASCDILLNTRNVKRPRYNLHEPVLIGGTRLVSQEQKIELGYAGYLVGKVEKAQPRSGKIISIEGKSHRIKLAPIYRKLRSILNVLQRWSEETPKAPPPILNRNCPTCRFRDDCRQEALNLDHLSLLGGMSLGEIERQNSRGIFTVTQYSFTYRPRKQIKGHENRNLKYYPSLKALALREKQTYVVHRPEQPTSKTQIFLDIEGIPDRGQYYLIGLRIHEQGSIKTFSFWADTEAEEKRIWHQFQEIIGSYEDLIIYHYGDYEARAINAMTRRFGDDSTSVGTIPSVSILVRQFPR